MDQRALLQRAAPQFLATGFGFSLVAILLGSDATAVANAMWRAVVALVVFAMIAYRMGATSE